MRKEGWKATVQQWESCLLGTSQHVPEQEDEQEGDRNPRFPLLTRMRPRHASLPCRLLAASRLQPNPHFTSGAQLLPTEHVPLPRRLPDIQLSPSPDSRLVGSGAHPERFGHCNEIIPGLSSNSPRPGFVAAFGSPGSCSEPSYTGARFGKRTGMRSLVSRLPDPISNHSQLHRRSQPQHC